MVNSAFLDSPALAQVHQQTVLVHSSVFGGSLEDKHSL